MRSWRRAHAAVAAVMAVTATLAIAQPAEVPSAGSGAAPAGPPPKPAGSSPVESADLPDLQPSPPRFAVAPFENRSGVRAFDWLIAGAPFEMSEKTEDVLGLEPTGGPLHVGGDAIAPEPTAVAAFAAARDAAWVITGWVERPHWQLRLGVALWKVAGRAAVPVAQVDRTGDVKAYHQLLGEVLAEAWARGGVAIDVGR